MLRRWLRKRLGEENYYESNPSIKPLYPLPDANFRRRFVELVEQGEADAAMKMLKEYYNMPNEIKVVTPEQLLLLKELEFHWMGAFFFMESEELAKKYPSQWKEFLKWWGRIPEERSRVGAYLQKAPDEGRFNDYIIVTEYFIKHPAPILHEFWHLHGVYVNEPRPNGAKITDPKTWDPFTKAFIYT